MKRGAPKSDPEVTRAFNDRSRRSSAESLKSSRSKLTDRAARSSSVGSKRSGFTPASKRQRIAVENFECLVCGGWNPDPAHLCARAQGGCDEPLCVVPLCRSCHRLFDDGRLDLLPYLVPGFRDGIGHALGHYNGDLIALLQRLTGTRWGPLEGVEGL